MPACLALLTRLGNLELSANKLNALKHLDSMYPHVDQFHFELFQTDRRHAPYWMLKEIRTLSRKGQLRWLLRARCARIFNIWSICNSSTRWCLDHSSFFLSLSLSLAYLQILLDSTVSLDLRFVLCTMIMKDFMCSLRFILSFRHFGSLEHRRS